MLSAWPLAFKYVTHYFKPHLATPTKWEQTNLKVCSRMYKNVLGKQYKPFLVQTVLQRSKCSSELNAPHVCFRLCVFVCCTAMEPPTEKRPTLSLILPFLFSLPLITPSFLIVILLLLQLLALQSCWRSPHTQQTGVTVLHCPCTSTRWQPSNADHQLQPHYFMFIMFSNQNPIKFNLWHAPNRTEKCLLISPQTTMQF